VPVPMGWPPRGSPSGRWRAVGVPLRSGGPRGGRLCAVAVPVPFWWPPRGSPSGRWRRARVPVWGRRGAPRSAGAASRGAGGAPKSSGGASVSVPPNPVGPACRAPEGGWFVGPVVRLAAPPRGVGLSGRGRALRVSFRGRAVGGSWETRGWLYRLSEEGRWRRLLPWVRLPRGVGSLRPPVALRARGASPSGPCCRRASAFRGRSSALLRGVIATRRGRTAWLLRRGGAVRFRVGAGGAEAPSLPWRVRVCFAGAEAPGPRLRGPLRGLSAPPKGGGRPVRLCAVFPSGPRAFRSLCFAEARQGRHVPAHRGGLGPVPPRRFRCVLGCPRTRRRGRLCAEARRLRSPVMGRGPVGELPVAGRGPGSGGGRVLSGALRQAARRSRGAFLRRERARATAPLGESWNHIP
jgi:hypothetical protein